MSLDWNLTKIKDHETLCWIPLDTKKNGKPQFQLNLVTETLIWATMGVDMGTITEKNYREFYFRINAWEKVNGPFLVNRPITEEDVKAHIGLSTNVFPAKTRKQFLKKLAQCALTLALRRKV